MHHVLLAQVWIGHSTKFSLQNHFLQFEIITKTYSKIQCLLSLESPNFQITFIKSYSLAKGLNPQIWLASYPTQIGHTPCYFHSKFLDLIEKACHHYQLDWITLELHCDEAKIHPTKNHMHLLTLDVNIQCMWIDCIALWPKTQSNKHSQCTTRLQDLTHVLWEERYYTSPKHDTLH